MSPRAAWLVVVAIAASLGACGDETGRDSAPVDSSPVSTEATSAGDPSAQDPPAHPTGASDVGCPWPADLTIPELHTVGDLPDGAAVVVVRADGTLEWDGEPASYSEVTRGLSEVAAEAPILFASDRNAPWGVVHMLLVACATSAHAHIFHAARPADGGAPGAFGTCLPTDARPHDADPTQVASIRVTVTTDWPPSDVFGVHAPIAAQRGAVVDIDAAPSATVGRILRIADIAALEGAAAVWFAGVVVPRSDAEYAASLATWRAADRARRIRVNGTDVAGPPPLVPAGARVTGRTAGFDSPYAGTAQSGPMPSELEKIEEMKPERDDVRYDVDAPEADDSPSDDARGK